MREVEVIKGSVIATEEPHPTEVFLVVRTEDGRQFRQGYDSYLVRAQASRFKMAYGTHPRSAKGKDVNVADDPKSGLGIITYGPPLKTLGGDVLAEGPYPVPMSN